MVPQTPPAHAEHWAPYLAARQGADPKASKFRERPRVAGQGVTRAPKGCIDCEVI